MLDGPTQHRAPYQIAQEPRLDVTGDLGQMQLGTAGWSNYYMTHRRLYLRR